MSEFYVLDVRHKGDLLLWGKPNNAGYTLFLDRAGRYTSAEIAAHPSYYNNGESTVAVPCDEVDKAAHRTVYVDDLGAMLAARWAS